MKKNIIVLFGLFLGVSNINCFNFNPAGVKCVTDNATKNNELIKLFGSCANQVSEIINQVDSGNINYMDVVKKVLSDDKCKTFFILNFSKYLEGCPEVFIN